MRRRRRAGPVTVALAGAVLVAGAGGALGKGTTGPCGDPASRPWCNRALSPDRRADLLLHALTPDEEVSLLAGVASSVHTGRTPAIPRVGLRSVALTDGPWGVKQGKATAVPIPLALAATFDPRLARLHGAVVAEEAKDKGNDVILGPTVNIMRTPLGGRTFEAYGEDPYLVSRTAVAWIEGAQSRGVIAEVKHFCCNNQEGVPFSAEKMWSSSDLDERTLHEVYLPAFEAAVKEAHVGSVMCAYNRVDEDWSCENRHLLTDILKRDWHFPGMVVSDWQAVHETVRALRNGLDLEMPTAQDYSPTNVELALASGAVSKAQVDDHVHRFLRTLFAAGFFDRPAYRNDDRQIDVAGHARDTRVIEESAVVLLKNAHHVLPLDTRRLRSIALIGPQADRFEQGGPADDVKPFRYDTPRQEVTERVGPHVRVVYDDGTDHRRAAAVAKAADVAVVFASDAEAEDREKTCASVDCSATTPGSDQDGLVAAVAAANPRTVVVLETGDPVLTPWRGKVAGLLEAWYPSQEGGAAITRVLFGDVDPGGRLPVTFPAKEGDIPTAGDPTRSNAPEVLYREGVFVGYRWYDEHHLTPAYPFGAGLSYTTFRFDDLHVRAGRDVAVTVTARVTNTGSRAGWAVPQLYLGLPSPAADVPQPPRQLRGYRKLSLAPGQSRVVRFLLDERAFSYWDVDTGGWRVAPGCYRVYVGSSSRDLPLRGLVSRGGRACGR